MHSNGELLGTSCGKRQDAALVWIINILLHELACISRLLHSWAAFSLTYGSWKYHAHSCNNSRYCMLTRVIRYIYVVIWWNYIQCKNCHFKPYHNSQECRSSLLVVFWLAKSMIVWACNCKGCVEGCSGPYKFSEHLLSIKNANFLWCYCDFYETIVIPPVTKIWV